jgi:hypothetical protein
VQADPQREKDWEWALTHEADNLMYEARDKLASAYAPPDKALDKAEKQANHNRIMAKGLGQKRWGQRENALGGPVGATVSYNFNVALLPGQQERVIREQHRVVESKVDENPPVEFSLEGFLGSGMNEIDLAIPPEDMGYEEAKGQESSSEDSAEDEL